METKFTWDDSYSIGINQIDDQHKKLISLFQYLCDSLNIDNSNEKLEDIFMELAKYANYHFETEEGYFDMDKYPGSEKHLEEHRDFTQGLLFLYHDFRGNPEDLPLQLFHFLQNWINNHILGTDKDFGRYLRK